MTAWTAPPPPIAEDLRGVLLRRPIGAAPLRAWLLGPIVGLYTHYVEQAGVTGKGREKPCYDPEDCPLCPLDRRWKGYAPALALVMDPVRGGSCYARSVIEFSLNAYRDLRGKDRRGADVLLRRHGKARNAPVKAELRDTPPPIDLPEPFDFADLLRKLWGVQRLPGEPVPQQSETPPAVLLPFRKPG
jgi:hypothetical protein